MEEWRDEGVVLAVRRHGETAAIVELFTAAHGRHLGVVRGGVSRRLRPILQPGAQLSATWRARLGDHLGAFTVEPVLSRAELMADRHALAALNAMTALLSAFLPEREPQARLYAMSQEVIARLGTPAWAQGYLLWEVALLDEMGFGLDLTRCAVTGGAEQLAYVSPRTGRAVSREGAGEWADRLLPLSPALQGRMPATAEDIAGGLRVTGHFLARLAADLGDRPLPPARARLLGLVAPH